jgi:tetratricopeptide (TPR) repeat protein
LFFEFANQQPRCIVYIRQNKHNAQPTATIPLHPHSRNCQTLGVLRQSRRISCGLNYGVLLAKQGQHDSAKREFEETIRLEPNNAKAQEYLAQLQAMKRRAP